MKTLVLGIGNVLMGDEGVGVEVINRMAGRIEDLPGIDCLDGGTGGFHLLGYFQEYRRIILIDATLDGEPPGTIKVIRPRYADDYPVTLSAHEIGLKDLIDATYLSGRRPEVVLVTISIADLNEVTMELSPEITRAIPGVIKTVMEIIKADR